MVDCTATHLLWLMCRSFGRRICKFNHNVRCYHQGRPSNHTPTRCRGIHVLAYQVTLRHPIPSGSTYVYWTSTCFLPQISTQCLLFFLLLCTSCWSPTFLLNWYLLYFPSNRTCQVGLGAQRGIETECIRVQRSCTYRWRQTTTQKKQYRISLRMSYAQRHATV